MRHLFKMLIPQRQNILIVQFNLLHEYFFMAFFYARTEEREDFEERTEWKSVEIYSLWTEKHHNWWKWIPIAGLEPHCSDYSVFLSSYENTQTRTAPELRRLFKGDAY